MNYDFGAGTSSSSKSRVSLGDDYDGRRVVTTPLSLHACHLEGVDPWALTLRGHPPRSSSSSGGGVDDDDDRRTSSSKRSFPAPPSSPRNRNNNNNTKSPPRRLVGTNVSNNNEFLFDAAVPQSQSEREMKEEFLEHRRQFLLQSVMKTYKKLSSSRSTLPPPPATLTGSLPANYSEYEKPQFSKKPKSVTSTLKLLASSGSGGAGGENADGRGGGDLSSSAKSLSNATVLSEENSQEVARYYEKLRDLKQKRWEQNLKTEMRDREARAHWKKQQEEREEKQHQRGSARDHHLVETQQKHEERIQEKMHEIEKNMNKESERFRRVTERRRQHEEEKRERGKTHGDHQRQQAHEKEMERQQKIQDKNDALAASQMDSSIERQKQDAERAFKRELQNLSARDNAIRASRAQEYRQEVFTERVNVSNFKARERKNNFNDNFHDAMVQRDAVHRMKESLTTFFETLPNRPGDVSQKFNTSGEPGGDLKVIPPPPASPRSRNNNNNNKFGASSSSSLLLKDKKYLLTGSTSSGVAAVDELNPNLPAIQPPAWLTKEVGKLHDSTVSHHRSRSRSANGSGRSVIIRNNKDGGEDEDGSASGRRSGRHHQQVKRAVHERRWPFTKPESNLKVATPRWMMTGDD